MSEKFDASKYLRKLNGKDYLEVKWRLLWLRTEHPDALVTTQLVKHEPDGPAGPALALFRAEVALPDGGRATGGGGLPARDPAGTAAGHGRPGEGDLLHRQRGLSPGRRGRRRSLPRRLRLPAGATHAQPGL